MEDEAEIQCPSCGEMITLIVDVSVSDQSYIEDCSVCCKPIQIDIVCNSNSVVSMKVEAS